jgi:uncharacterized membrane protein YfcA
MWVNQTEPGAGDEDLELHPAPEPRSADRAASGRGGSVVVSTGGRPRIDVTPIVVAKVLLAGTVVGFVTGFFGVGGGFVVVPALVLTLGFTMPEAVGTSLLVITINSGVALAGRVGEAGVDWAFAAPFTVAALLGVSVGKHIADRLPTVVLVRGFVALLVAVAVYVAVRAGVALSTT